MPFPEPLPIPVCLAEPCALPVWRNEPVPLPICLPALPSLRIFLKIAGPERFIDPLARTPDVPEDLLLMVRWARPLTADFPVTRVTSLDGRTLFRA